MAYTPVNWQTGDTITAEKLNKMDNGWGYESTQLFSETVTTVDQGGTNGAELAYSGTIDADTITVTYDGTEYTCPRIDNGDSYFYGGFNDGPDFTTYPFFIFSEVGQNQLITPTAGTHTVAVSAPSLQTSADFDAARGYGYKDTQLFSETVTTADQDGMYSAQLSYSGNIDTDTITVTFDGTKYVCPRIDADGQYFYGGFSEQGPTFTEYPFAISSSDSYGNFLATQTAGEHTVAVSVSTLQTSADFAEAVATSSNLPLFISIGTTTWQEAHDAMAAGRMAYAYDPLTNRLCLAVYATSNTTTNTYTITCMTIFSGSTITTTKLSAQSPTDPLTT